MISRAFWSLLLISSSLLAMVQPAPIIPPHIHQKIDTIRVQGTPEEKQIAARVLQGTYSVESFECFLQDQENQRATAREQQQEIERYKKSWEGQERSRQQRAVNLLALIETRVWGGHSGYMESQCDYATGSVQNFITILPHLLQERKVLADEYKSWTAWLQNINTFWSPFVCTYKYDDGVYKVEYTGMLLQDMPFTNRIMPLLQQAEPHECDTILTLLDQYKVHYLSAAAIKYANMNEEAMRYKPQPKVHAYNALKKRGLSIDEKELLRRIVGYGRGYLPFVSSILASHPHLLQNDSKFAQSVLENAVAGKTKIMYWQANPDESDRFYGCPPQEQLAEQNAIIALVGNSMSAEQQKAFIASYEARYKHLYMTDTHAYEGLLSPEEVEAQRQCPEVIRYREVLDFLKQTFSFSANERV